MPRAGPPQRGAWSSPGGWYAAALAPLGLGWFMYALEAGDVERFRLREPVPAVGEFVSATCVTYRKGHDRDRMQLHYAFKVPGFVRYAQSDATPQPAEDYTLLVDVVHDSRAECEAELPAVRAAREPHPVWYERSEPRTARSTLEEPDSRRFLWLWLGALPLAGVGVWLQWRARAMATRRAGF